jgi:hypothetical protein
MEDILKSCPLLEQPISSEYFELNLAFWGMNYLFWTKRGVVLISGQLDLKAQIAGRVFSSPKWFSGKGERFWEDR